MYYRYPRRLVHLAVWAGLSCTAVLVPVAGASAESFDGSWLEGRWCLQEGPRLTVETWLPQAGGQWLGVSHAVRDGQLRSFEYLRIGPHDGGWAYFAQPGGRPATVFPLVHRGPTELRFHNPDHDFPQTIVYHRDGDQLQAEISGPGQNGDEQVIRYAYTACPSA